MNSSGRPSQRIDAAASASAACVATLGVELGQRGGLAQVRAPAEHGDGKGELAGGRAEPAQAGEGRPGDRLGRDLRHPHGAGFVGHDAVGRERAQQFAQEKRIAARRHMTGVREGL